MIANETEQEKVQVNVRLDPEIYAIIDKMAKEQDRKPTYIVRKIVESALAKISA